VAIATASAPRAGLSRQAMANQANSSAAQVATGAYVPRDCDGSTELILIGSGTELDLCVKAGPAAERRGQESAGGLRSPCVELFEEQAAS